MPKPIGTWNPARGTWDDPNGAIDLLSEHSEPFSATWPTSGMTRAGAAYELPTPALPTAATASSSLPTPRASRGASGTETMYALGAERTDEHRTQGQVSPPTPTTSAAKGAWSGGEGGPNLQAAVLLPTPMTGYSGRDAETWLDQRPAGNGQRRTVISDLRIVIEETLLPTATGSTSTGPWTGGEGGPNLQQAVSLLPTPQAHDHVDGKTAEQVAAMRKRTGAGVWNLNEVAANELSLLPTPQVADVTGGHKSRSGARSNELLLPGVAEKLARGATTPPPSSAGSPPSAA